jgi:TRAP-type C4-dicarboxylate transport system substrate-binding protein
MPFPEVYPALEQKAIDGHENPATVIKANKIYEVQKYLALTRHIYNPQALIVSKKFWDKLNPDEKALITEAAAQATTYQRGVSRTQADIAVEDLKKAGMQVTELPPAEIAKLREKVKPVVEKQTAIVGADTVAALQSELAKLRK